jgi:hypothetical protein
MTRTTTSAFALIILLAGPALAQVPPRDHILNMAGCFDVTYYFHEDGEHDYFNPEKPPALVNEEFIAVTEDEPARVVLQHATIGEGGRAVPHWHQVWTQEEGGWTQSVFGRTPGDEDRQLRYRCTAPWSMNQWSCVIGAAPKPFRDSGAPFGFFREDYNYLFRDNAIIVTPRGWVQSERNRKFTEDGDLVGHELGYIIYSKWDEARCDEVVTDRSELEQAN